MREYRASEKSRALKRLMRGNLKSLKAIVGRPYGIKLIRTCANDCPDGSNREYL